MIDPHPPFTDSLNPAHRGEVARSVMAIEKFLGIQKRHVLDIGCNTGVWVRGFMDRDWSCPFGIDLEHMRPNLLIPEKNFRSVDLTRPLPKDFHGGWELVLCLEVGEHLPESAADTLVDSCCHAGPLVLFSAATPGQGGHGHINEQPHEYWAAKFAERGYSWETEIRAVLPEDLAWWYTRNMAVCRRSEEPCPCI